MAAEAPLLPRPTMAVAAAPVEAMVAVVPVAVGLAAVTAEMTLVEAARVEAAATSSTAAVLCLIDLAASLAWDEALCLISWNSIAGL